MAINVNFAGANILKPGAYSQTRVNLSGGFPLAATGIVAIIGEALGGAPGSSEGVQTFTSEDIASLIDKYKSGPIVDAARILVAPARDARVPNGASLIRVYKTNSATQSSLVLQNAAPANLFTLTSRNFGEDENLISVKVEQGVVNTDARIITVQKGDLKEVLSENEYAAILVIQYVGAGTAATLSIASGALTTSITGAASDNLNIALAGKTVQQLVDLIDAHAAYTCTSVYKQRSSRSAADLDPISTALDIMTAKTLRAQQDELLDIINGESQLISATRVANVEGIIATVASKKFLTGGTRGSSTNARFQAGFDALLALRCNTVVPLVSRDASALIAIGETDPASTFTVDAVNAQALTHCVTASNTKNRSERNCYVSKKAAFASAQAAAQDLNHERASLLFQDVEVLGADGELAFKDPWAAACIVAGVQAGTPVGTPATFKGINANGIQHQDYNSKTQVDLAIQAGLLPLEEVDSGGIRIVVHNSTYSKDANEVYNRPSVLEAADYVAFNLRQQLEAIFVGEKARSGSAEAIKNAVISIMSAFLQDEIIVGDDTNENLGWKNLTVTISGNKANVEVTITPVQGIDFVLNRITLDSIRQSA
jgi:hypothetical protein